MAKPIPAPEPVEPKLRVYKVLRPLTNLKTNEVTEPGEFIEMFEDRAARFIEIKAVELTKKKPSKGD